MVFLPIVELHACPRQSPTTGRCTVRSSSCLVPPPAGVHDALAGSSDCLRSIRVQNDDSSNCIRRDASAAEAII